MAAHYIISQTVTTAMHTRWSTVCSWGALLQVTNRRHNMKIGFNLNLFLQTSTGFAAETVLRPYSLSNSSKPCHVKSIFALVG